MTRPPSVVHQLGRGPQIGHGAQSRGGRRDGDQAGGLGDQVLPLPGRQLAGLDVDLGPFHLGAIPIRRTQPRRDVCLVVQPGDHRFIAQSDSRRRRVGQRVEQDGAVGPEDHAARVGVDQVGDRLAGRVEHRGAALRGRMRTGRRRHRVRGTPSRRWWRPSRAAACRSARRNAPNHRPETDAIRAPGRRRMPCQPP